MSSKVKWVVIVAIVLLVGVTVAELSSFRTDTVKVSAQELVEAYLADEATADVQYAGVMIQLTGVVTEIQESPTPTVILYGNGMNQIQCVLKTGVNQSLPQRVGVGDTVTFTGVCNGLLMDVIIRDCSLLTN